MWAVKHRPTTLDGVVGQDDATDLFRGCLETGLRPHFICYGKPGVGKTTTCMCYANALRATVLMLNSSDDNGIEVVRQRIKDFVTCGSVTGQPKIVILDECDAMTEPSQKAL